MFITGQIPAKCRLYVNLLYPHKFLMKWVYCSYFTVTDTKAHRGQVSTSERLETLQHHCRGWLLTTTSQEELFQARMTA